MSPSTERLRRLVVEHLADISAGRCEIDDEAIAAEPDEDTREVLAGLLMLHEDLLYERSRGDLAQQLEAVNAELRQALAYRDEAEELQRRLLHADRLASIGQLAAGVAHEINNPAAFVLTNHHTLRRLLGECDPGPEHEATLAEARELVAENEEGVRRIVRIVKDLRSFARIERDDVELVDVNEILDAACNLTNNEIRHRARLIRDMADLPPIAADRGKLAQVFTNLLVNAAQAIDGAGADNTIEVATRVAGEQLVISVADTGCGMTEEVRARMFEPFFTTKSGDRGTGLGMAISSDIVRQHGGEIRVESRPGAGSRIEVVLPLETPLAASVRSERPLSDPVTLVRARVLVIDDERSLLDAIVRTLRYDHDVVGACGGADALELLRTDAAFDVILCDMMMPGVDGVSVFEALGAEHPQLCDRVVFCTGGAFTPRAKQLLASVRNVCLDKPVEPETLLRVVAQIAGG